jgi:hypothetical protein
MTWSPILTCSMGLVDPSAIRTRVPATKLWLVGQDGASTMSSATRLASLVISFGDFLGAAEEFLGFLDGAGEADQGVHGSPAGLDDRAEL